MNHLWWRYLAAFAALFCIQGKAWSRDDTIAKTPPMGWNSWNLFQINITESDVKAVTDAFVTSGLKDAGYQYIVVDDCWSNSARDASNTLVAQSAKFPSGMKSLADYVHGKGLKFGMYASPTRITCCREAGSYGHETIDAGTFASWGVDFLKYDWCGVQSGEDNTNLTATDIIARYVTMREALKATNRPILYALCEKGQKSNIVPGTWSDTVGHMWRIGGDISASWSSIIAHIDEDASLGIYAGSTKGWNDPDMLEVGNGSITENENRAHFSMWCILAAPLILGNDPSSMPSIIKTILTNKEAIAINQDSLGFQGVRIKKNGNQEVWVKPLKNGDRAVAFFNRDSAPAVISVNWTDSLIKWNPTTKVAVRNIWVQSDSSNVSDGFSDSVASHAVVLLRISNGISGVRQNGYRIVDGNPVKSICVQKNAQGARLFISMNETGLAAELLDIQGKNIYTPRVKSGWNLIPDKMLGTGLNVVRISNGQRSVAVLILKAAKNSF
jgi:alpha-galactosidase